MDVLALLQAKGIEVTPKGNNEYSIICPNAGQHQDGQDSIASFNINTEKLVGHCFACNYSLSEVGLTKWLMGESLNETQMRSLKLKAAMKRVKSDSQLTLVDSASVETMMPPGELWNEDYRGISKETYTRLGAIHCTRGRYADRICFPVVVDDKLLGVDARTLLPNVQPKYLRPAHCNCREEWLFPWDIVKEIPNKQFVIIGEGVFHSINSYDKGYPGLCCFGSNNWSNAKVMKLLDLNVGEVVYFRDNDKAGRTAEQRICASLVTWFEVTVIEEGYIPEGKDLGDLTQEELDLAMQHRVKPKLPKCLVEHPFGGVKIVPGSICYDRRCVFCSRGKCNNIIE